MRVGVVNFYKSKTEFPYELCEALKFIGYDILVINLQDDWYNIIKSSHIKNWIFSGSGYTVLDYNTPQINSEILDLKNKRFFLICYSMESFLFQMGCQLVKRKKGIKEFFNLDTNNDKIYVYRHHYYYIEPDSLKPCMRLLATYNDETMTVKYKNIMMTQWHPEKTIDGIKIIKNWLSLKN